MRNPPRPHLLGIDDGPVTKGSTDGVVIVAVMTEGPDLVEGVAVTRFPVDGPDATGFLSTWVEGLRFLPAVHAIVLGGITIAGLGVVDLPEFAERTGVPVIAVNSGLPSSNGAPRRFVSTAVSTCPARARRRRTRRACSAAAPPSPTCPSLSASPT
jgi:endonuclease V-like protein UPF0215 family